jgi:hypothetical protein
VKMQTKRNAILVEAVSDLLATLTVPRREKDADRVRQLRWIQCHQGSTAPTFKDGTRGTFPNTGARQVDERHPK